MQRRPQIFSSVFSEHFADGQNLQGILQKGLPIPGGNLFPKM
jgi:hypothetical protein